MKAFNRLMKIISAIISLILMILLVPCIIQGWCFDYIGTVLMLYIDFYAISYLSMALLISENKTNIIKSAIFIVIDLVPLISFVRIDWFNMHWVYFIIIALLILPIVLFVRSLLFKKGF